MTAVEIMNLVRLSLDDGRAQYYTKELVIHAVNEAQLLKIHELIVKGQERGLRKIITYSEDMDSGDSLPVGCLQILSVYSKGKALPLRYEVPELYFSHGSGFSQSKQTRQMRFTVFDGVVKFDGDVNPNVSSSTPLKAVMWYVRKPWPFGKLMTSEEAEEYAGQIMGLEIAEEYHPEVAMLATELLTDINVTDNTRDGLSNMAKIPPLGGQSQPTENQQQTQTN